MNNEKMNKDFKEITKIDPSTGKYTNAQKVGRNISIGILVILMGILYSFGGISLVITSFSVIVILLFIIALIVYILIKTKVV